MEIYEEKNTQKLEVLKLAYEDQRKEAVFWRERSFKATIRLIGLLLAVSGAAVFFNQRYPVVLIPLVLLAVIAHVYLKKNFRRYSECKERLLQIEKSLGFFEQDEFLTGEPLYPSKFQNAEADIRGSGSFIWAIWLIAVSTALSVIFRLPPQ